MQMFVPVPDEWDSGEQFVNEVMVPYHVGVPIWIEYEILDDKPSE